MATKITNTQKVDIQARLEKGEGIAKIAKELKLPLSAVKDYLVGLFEAKARINEINKKAAKDAKPPNARDLMITKTRDQKRSGVAIMTPAASQRGDQHREEIKGDGGKAFLDRYSDCMHTIDPSRTDGN